MKRIICACALAGISAMPANAPDGISPPAVVSPPIVVPPGQHNPNLQRPAKELLEQAAQLRRGGTELLAQAQPGGAKADETSIVGTWQITGFAFEYQDTKEIVRPVNRPTGYLQYSPGGHMVVFVADGDLPRPATPPTHTDAERAKIWTQIIGAYAGTYQIEGDKVIHHVLNAWFPTWIGTDQIRYFKIDGNNFAIKTAPITTSLNGRQIVSTLAFERVE
jgi:hypothetical protein